ncbi:Hypothetical predicted protein [Mytilus galloprovincialis]|uniref:C1q domain-containing protein n=1 Tax=Mytilus galloprovincialis TaxID=29158 RepID=A0A8B6G1Q8_MYTGA|nr:Hypothetical predicted protein [Mytilus galloprovincialis]
MGCSLVMLVSSFVLVGLLFQGCESLSEERFLKLVEIVENQNSRISDMENIINEQEVHIKRMNERLTHMETKLKKTELKRNKLDLCKCEALRFPVRHSFQKNNDNKIKQRHSNEQMEPVVRNKYDVNTRKRLLVQPTAMQSSQIGFYAYLGQNEDSPSKHHTIIFDVQKTNVGNGYNPFSGLFTAPQDGLYTFSTSITMLHHYASFDVVKNADVQGSFFVDAGGVGEYRSSSTTIFLALVKGDVVFVRTSATYVPHGSIHSSKDGRSSFTGWLIQ